MAFKRGGTYSIYIPRRIGGPVIRGTGSGDKRLVGMMERMVRLLKDRREWDLLDALVEGGNAKEIERNGEKVLKHEGRITLGELYDAYAENDLDGLRARLRDVDIEPHIEGWVKTLQTRFEARRKSDVAIMYPRQVRSLIPEGKPFPRTNLTVDRVNQWLAGLVNQKTKKPLNTGTRLRYHAALSSFCRYLVSVGVLERNLMRDVEAPRPSKSRMRSLSPDEMRALIAAQPAPFNVISALAHCGIELGVILGLRKRHVDLKARTVFAAGTKTSARARTVYLFDFAAPLVSKHVEAMLPNALLFEGISQDHALRVHKAACKAVGIEDYRIHDGRHTFAVWAVKRGVPAEVIAAQLGHANTKITMGVYARYATTAEDRAAIFRKAELAEKVEKRAGDLPVAQASGM